MEQIAHLEDEEPFVVHNIKEVIQILTDLAKQRTMLKVSFNAGSDVYLTTVIKVDVENQAVYLDVGQDEIFNSRLLASRYVLFSKESGIRIRWASDSISMVTLADGPAIKIAIPESLVRLQRRDFFRLATPAANPVICQIPVIDETYPAFNRTLELVLADIGLGGVGLVAYDPLDSALVVGASFNECQIDLPDVGIVSLTLQVRSVIPSPVKDGMTKYRIGLLYVKPTPRVEALVHRYTFNLEREFCSRNWNH
ncbi:flagellar brake protein YcgR [mine drainage metagenome]|uniref:Flagellar brake protein YcgR n=1 Tax=mine drainage metagenome TaxID=410659 RepID=A0A1J5TNG4_9ZZZZ